ncbi:MAG: acyl-ACP--UDP-N-acetylglucosamine O-acyltransferase [Actinobacteria bacterium]|nr:acyl-ACP--UDP-N-acetylglucosamine O-acyltransferase [Actinomycetota bacterium]
MPKIHPLACVDPAAEIADDASIGPFCVIGPQVKIGPGCILHNSVTMVNDVVIGANNEFFANVVIGTPPQDLSYDGKSVTKVRMGDANVFRAGSTVNGGSDKFRNETRVGSNGMFMINSHIGHDSYIGDDCLIVNGSNLGGHNHLESNARLSGVLGSHPFVTFGRYCYIGGVSAITRDVPPFTVVAGAYPSKIRCINEVGLRMAGFSEESITALKRAFRRLFRSGLPKRQLVDEFEDEGIHDENVIHLVKSLRRSACHQHNRFLEGVYLGQVDPEGKIWDGCRHPWARSLLGAQAVFKQNCEGARP